MVLAQSDHVQRRLAPAVAALVVGVAVAYYAIASPVGSRAPSSLVIAGLVVSVTVVALVGAVRGNETLTLGAGAVLFVGGMAGFALGPQLWTVATLVALVVFANQRVVAVALLVVLGLLELLTVLTTTWHRTAVVALATVVFAVAVGTVLDTLRGPTNPT